jgi:hypothetical protein
VEAVLKTLLAIQEIVQPEVCEVKPLIVLARLIPVELQVELEQPLCFMLVLVREVQEQIVVEQEVHL